MPFVLVERWVSWGAGSRYCIQVSLFVCLHIKKGAFLLLLLQIDSSGPGSPLSSGRLRGSVYQLYAYCKNATVNTLSPRHNGCDGICSAVLSASHHS